MVHGLVIRVVVRLGAEEYHIVAIEGAMPLMPLSWLVLLAVWSHQPVAIDGQLQVEVAPPQGAKIMLTERPKMHYLDQGTFMLVLQDVWKNCALQSGMTSDQLTSALFHRKVQCTANTVCLSKEPSIRFLDMRFNRRAYMRRVVDAR